MQNIDVEKCQQGHQVPLLMVFRFFKQRHDQWAAELAATGQRIPPYDAIKVCVFLSHSCHQAITHSSSLLQSPSVVFGFKCVLSASACFACVSSLGFSCQLSARPSCPT